MKESDARLYFAQRLASCYSSRSVTSLSSSMLSVNTKAPCQGHRVTAEAAHGPDEKRERKRWVRMEQAVGRSAWLPGAPFTPVALAVVANSRLVGKHRKNDTAGRK